MKSISRQGDVALLPVKSVKGAAKRENKILAYGEVSGHHHTALGDCELYEKDGKMYVVTGKGQAFLAHLKEADMTMADHHPIQLEPDTTYEVRLQKQFDPYANVSYQVAD